MKRTLVIVTLISIIILVSSYIASATYALISNTGDKSNADINEIITPYDINNEFVYNYLIDKLNLTDEEAKLVINSIKLNNTYKELIENINSNHMTSEELSDTLIDIIDNERLINNELKNKLNTAINNHKLEISKYLNNLIKQKRRISK